MSSTTQTKTSTQPIIATIGSPSVQDVTVDMNYVKENDAGEQPSYPQLHALDPAFTTTKTVAIKDVRGSKSTPSLGNNGYEYFNLDFDKDIDYTNEDDIKSKWYPQIAAALKEKLGAAQVIPFNHIVRNATHDRSVPMTAGYKGPAVRPHLDISSLFGPTVLQDKVAEKYLDKDLMSTYLDITRTASVDHKTGNVTTETVTSSKKHWQILNIWRPLSTVERDPLAVTDAASVRPRDMIHIQLPYKPADPTAKTGFLRAPVAGEDDDAETRKHEWFYMSRQKPEEVLLFRQYDSEGKLGLPHTAFVLPGQDETGPARQSIETRLFAFY